MNAGVVKADDVSELKAQMKALNARLSDIEKQKTQIQQQKDKIKVLNARLEQVEQQKSAQGGAQLVSMTPGGVVVPVSGPGGNYASYKDVSPARYLGFGEPRKDNPVLNANSFLDFPEKFRIIDTLDTTVAVYAVLEATINSNSTGGPYASANADLTKPVINKRWIGVDKPWLSANRWGFDASHVLDAETNLVILARLESEFELPTGNQGTSGVQFERDAWIGLASPALGKLTVGRQDTIARDANMIWGNPSPNAKANLGEGGWYDNDIIVTPKTYFESPTGSRTDASVNWKKQWGENWITYFGYQASGLKDSQSGGQFDVAQTGVLGTLKEQEISAGLGYNSSDNMFHAAGTATFTNIDGFDKSVYAVGGNIIPVPWLRVNAGFIYADIAQPTAVGDRQDETYVSSVQINPNGKYEGVVGYNFSNTHNAGIDSNGNTLSPFDPATGAVTAGDGSLSTVYALGIYRLDKVTTFYVAGDYSFESGKYVDKVFNGNKSIDQIGVGVRYQF